MVTDNAQENSNDSHSEILQKDEVRIDYLLECFRSAQEELLLRFKYRENWLQIQLLSQVVLLALSQGVEIAGVKTLSPYPDVLALSTAISLVLASLYTVDDSLISYIGNYINSLTEAESKLRPGKWLILNWGSSEQVKQYVRSALPIRYLAQLTAFVIIPTILLGWRISGFAVWGTLQIIEVVINIIFLILIGFVVLRGFLLRRKAYLATRPPALKSIESTEH